jgi:hypothetical protein
MTRFTRLNTTRLLIFGVVVLVATSCSKKQPPVPERPQSVPEQAPPARERIAKTYGLDSFKQVEGIKYTFAVQFPGVNVIRSWEWEPKTDKVSYEGKDKDGKPVKVTYLRSQISSQPDVVKNEVDPNFVNDNYWLLLPFHVYWDQSPSVTDQGMNKLPVGDGSAELISVKYPADGGYTPGDTWDLFVDKDNRIEQMVYRRGGPKKPSVVIATWEGYKKAGPLVFSTDHRGTADGQPLQVTFSDVSVKVTGSENWMNAQ